MRGETGRIVSVSGGNGLITAVTGVILAGGQSTRMGSNKALLPMQGGRFIETIYRQLCGLFAKVLLVTNQPEQYRFLPCRTVADIYPGLGPLAGLHAGLHQADTATVFAVACDMPHLNSALIRQLAALRCSADVIIPQGRQGLEPLHALYHKACLCPMERALIEGRRRIISFFPQVAVHTVSSDQIAAIDPGFTSFRNINTPADYYDLRGQHCTTDQQPPVTGDPHLRMLQR